MVSLLLTNHFCSWIFFGCYIWILCNVTLPNLVICYILFYVARCVVWKWFLFLFLWVDLPGHLILFVTFVYVALYLLFYHVYVFLICVSCVAWDLYSYLYHVLLFCLVSLDLSFCIAVHPPWDAEWEDVTAHAMGLGFLQGFFLWLGLGLRYFEKKFWFFFLSQFRFYGFVWFCMSSSIF